MITHHAIKMWAISHFIHYFLNALVHTYNHFFSAMDAKFDCKDGDYIPEEFVCDADEDCKNGADEMNCSKWINLC